MSFKDLVKQNMEQLDKSFDESKSGVHIHKPNKVQKGKFIYEDKEIDETGKILKILPFKYLNVFHKTIIVGQTEYEKGPLGKAGKTSWKKKTPIHHDINIHNDTIWTLGRSVHKYKGRDVEFDTVETYDLDGKLLYRWSSWEHRKHLQKLHGKLELDRPKIPFIPEFAKRKTKSPWGGYYDYYRFNSIQIIPKNNLKFHEDKILISARHGSFLFVLDPKTNTVEWFMGPKEIEHHLEGQHAAQVLKNGNILLFDNGRYRGWSRVIAFHPKTKEITFEYKDNLFSQSQGHVELLPNNNYLITESEKGRAFQLTPQKKIVWEFYHPEKQNETNSMHPKNYGKRQWVYRMTFK